MPAPHPFDLLCERCGYDLRALSMTDRCPECGRPVGRSLAESRPGSAWQRRATARSYARTVRSLVVHPSQTFRAVSCDPGDAMTLQLANAFVVAVLGYAALVCAGLAMTLASGSNGVLMSVAALTFGIMLSVGTLVGCLIWMRVLALAAGLALRRVAGREIPGLADAIAAHAGMFLPAGAVVFWVALPAAVLLDAGSGVWNATMALVPIVLGASLALTLVGVWVNRFANRPGAQHSLNT